MPYISQTKRDEINFLVRDADNGHATWRRLVSFGEPVDEGELNYVISKLIHFYLGIRPNYSSYNEVIGVLENVKQELWRAHIGPYERQKSFDNGGLNE